MKIAIMQPYFLPYLGYFQLMASVQKFVVLDDVSFAKSGWANRDRIRSFGKTQWLTIPVIGASSNKLICDLMPQVTPAFINKHLRIVRGAYQRSVNFEEGFELFQRILEYPAKNLADFTRHSLLVLVEYLEISCKIIESSRVYDNRHLKGEDRVLDICERESARMFVNPPGGRDLYHPERFKERNLDIVFVDPQLKEYEDKFEPGLSILDVILKTSQKEASGMSHDYVLEK